MSIKSHEPFDERKYTPLQRMRRSDLRAMAKEYNIDLDLEGKKEEMLPIMELAQKRGVFEKPPVPKAPKEYKVEHLGVAFGWCVLDGDNIVSRKFKSKEEAQESLG